MKRSQEVVRDEIKSAQRTDHKFVHNKSSGSNLPHYTASGEEYHDIIERIAGFLQTQIERLTGVGYGSEDSAPVFIANFLDHDGAKILKKVRFRILSIPNGRKFLIPKGSKKVMLRSLDIYNPVNLKARVFKKFLYWAIKLGLLHFVLPVWQPEIKFRKYRKNEEGVIFQQLMQILHDSDLMFSVSLGTPGAHQKPVIQVMKQNSDVLGYAKIGWNRATRSLVQNESVLLDRLNSLKFKNFIMPELIQYDKVEHKLISVQSSLASDLKPVPVSFNEKYLKVIREISNIYQQEKTLEESKFYQLLVKKSQRIRDARIRELTKSIFQHVRYEFAGRMVPFHPCHGDFTPWNMKRNNGDLYLYDWEYGFWEGLPGYDLFHFLYYTELCLKNRSPVKTLSSILKLSTNKTAMKYWAYIQIPEHLVDDLFLFFLQHQLITGVLLKKDFREISRLLTIINLLHHEPMMGSEFDPTFLN